MINIIISKTTRVEHIIAILVSAILCSCNGKLHKSEYNKQVTLAEFSSQWAAGDFEPVAFTCDGTSGVDSVVKYADGNYGSLYIDIGMPNYIFSLREGAANNTMYAHGIQTSPYTNYVSGIYKIDFQKPEVELIIDTVSTNPGAQHLFATNNEKHKRSFILCSPRAVAVFSCSEGSEYSAWISRLIKMPDIRPTRWSFAGTMGLHVMDQQGNIYRLSNDDLFRTDDPIEADDWAIAMSGVEDMAKSNHADSVFYKQSGYWYRLAIENGENGQFGSAMFVQTQKLMKSRPFSGMQWDSTAVFCGDNTELVILENGVYPSGLHIQRYLRDTKIIDRHGMTDAVYLGTE